MLMSRNNTILSCLVVYLVIIATGGYVTSAAAADTGLACGLSDSLAVVRMTDELGALMHEFGTPGYAHEFDLSTSFPVFNSIFELYLTDTVSARWTSSDFETLIQGVVDNDSTLTDDVFGKIWYYFTREGSDANSYHAGIRFQTPISELLDLGDYTHIVIQLYAREDIPGYPTTCDGETYGVACYGYSTQLENVITINASPANSMDDVVKFGVAHELTHLCYNASGLFQGSGYKSVNETLATLGEYFVGAERPAIYDYPYDSSIIRGEACDSDSKYQVEKAWITYLYDVTRGNPSDPTDDLVYRWINSATSAASRMLLPELAAQLWDSEFSWVGGSDATDRLNRFFGNYLVAKFANAPDFATNSRFGAEEVNTFRDLHFFQDDCDFVATGAVPTTPVDCPANGNGIVAPDTLNHAGCWNVRVVLPSWELTDDHEDHLTSISDIYTDRDDTPNPSDGDTSADFVDVPSFGTDYVVFRAGEYYDDAAEHELRLVISGEPRRKHPPFSAIDIEIQPIGWVMGYSISSDSLQMHPESLLFVEPLPFTPSSTTGDEVDAREVYVTDFGRGIKSVVLALSCVSPKLPLITPSNYFEYAYSFGVYTPSATSREWNGDVYAVGDVDVVSGGTLNIEPGTRVKIFGSDLGETGDVDRVEFNIRGELVADGTEANPIVFEPWTSSATGDWVGFSFDSTSSGGTFDHCVIKKADAAVLTYAPLTMTNSQIDSCATAGVISGNGDLLIEDCQFTQPGYIGISVAADDAVIRNTKVDGALAYGLSTYAGLYPSVDVHGSWFMNCDTGLYVSGNVPVDVDSACFFYQNDTGIHFYNAGTASTVRSTGITWNTSGGILCDASSSPQIISSIFAHNGGAIYCSNSSSPKIEANEIQSAGNAITVASSSSPDIGHSSPTGGQSPGNNKIAHAGKYVSNSTGASVSAQNNCWDVNSGGCSPSSSKFSGTVDYSSPACCSFPTFTHNEGEPDFGESLVFQLPQSAPPPKRALVTALMGIVPNPFNPQTTIQYSLARQGKVEIKIYDVAGRLVETLANEAQIAGQHSVVWKGNDRRGSPVASGIYFVRLNAAGEVFTRKMVLLK